MISIPRDLVAFEVHGGEIVPVFFDRRDMPWLREALELFRDMVGRPLRELDARWPGAMRAFGPDRDSPSRPLVPIARHVLEQVFKPTTCAAIKPREVRRQLFTAASAATREAAIESTAASLGASADDLLASLFADLPPERRLTAPPDATGPEQVALEANTAMLRALLQRAIHVQLDLHGNSRTMVQFARMLGLMLEVSRADGGGRMDAHTCAHVEACRISITGPRAVLSRSTRYGHALARLLPILPWCAWFRLRADCRTGSDTDVEHTLVLTKNSPILPGPEPRRFDSRLESRFARDFVRATDRWTLVREPEPIAVGQTWIYPDFAIHDRDRAQSPWLLEIVGYWTEAYLTRKLAHVRAAGLARLILCVDRAKACEAGDLEGLDHALWFDHHIDVPAVLRVLEQRPGPSEGERRQ